jgi:stress response protein YsnF
MTTIRQLIQTSPVKANELFARLVDTSDNAIKTRERLLADLTAELELVAKLEEQHLFPVLRKHKETKDLVSDALNDNKHMRKLLAELEGVPKGSEEFAPKVAEIRKVFQQSVRDERKELLPAVLKALTDEEAQTVVAKFEDGKAEVEEARRVEADQRRAEARQEREQAEQKEVDDRERKAREAARQKESGDRERKSREAARQTADVAAESSRQMVQSAAESVQRVVSAPISTGSMFWDAMFGTWALPQGRSMARPSNLQGSTVQRSSSEEEVIPLAEETLVVGKHTVTSGTTTVRRYVVEVPVERQVTLYDEKVVVERRKPVTDAVTGETLTELTIEMIETSEVPLVAKGVTIREEVVIRRERTKRVETVRDTIRRDEIEISNAQERSGARRPALASSRK